MHGALIGLVIIGPVVLAVQGMITWSAQTDVAAQFVEQSRRASATSTRSPTTCARSRAGCQTAAGLLLPGMLALIFSMIYAPLWAVRTGLLTRFFGTLGMALGASLLFILQIALLAILLWFVYLGLLCSAASRRAAPRVGRGRGDPVARPGEEPAGARPAPAAR